ncbi:MAG: sigma-70 family RNA polymerase sigma factor [Prevotellaceae bacterium]|jgi:RNA polymerase sigma-70 factor (ECF subfamily)|nr:sigma-70 family RNA polymerase sigma factor [Prevotellaceae bacterium]
MILQIDNIKDKNDSELLSLFRSSRNSEYLGHLYNRYMHLVYGVCLKYLQNSEDAQDAVMQIFEFLLEKINKYEILVFRTWIYSVARNHCLQKLRKKNIEILTDFADNFMDFSDITHLLCEQDDEKQFAALKQCIEKLPETQRNCIKMFFLDEKSYAEISDETKYHLKSVKSYIQNGKRNLKICIENRLQNE